MSLTFTRCRLLFLEAENCHAGGREFESRRPRHSNPHNALQLSYNWVDLFLPHSRYFRLHDLWNHKTTAIFSASSRREAKPSDTLLYSSVWVFFECPIQNLIRSSGVRCFLSHAVRNLLIAWKPVFGTPSSSRIGCSDFTNLTDQRVRPFW